MNQHEGWRGRIHDAAAVLAQAGPAKMRYCDRLDWALLYLCLLVRVLVR